VALTAEGLIPHPGIASRYVRLPSGAMAHYMTAGDSGPVVILCHGGIPGSGGLAGSRYQLSALGDAGFQAYAPDFPAYGLADTSPEHYANLGGISHVLFLKEFVDTLGLKQFHLTGNSMGASITWRYTISYPWDVLSYILIAGNVPGYVDDSKIKRHLNVTDVNRAWFDGTTESMRKMMDPIIYRKDAITDDLLEMRTRAANNQTEAMKAYHAGGDRAAKDPSLRQVHVAPGRLEKVEVPHILLWGADDYLNPVENAYLQEDVMPWMQYFYPPECGHQGQTDQPELFNRVFIEFFGKGKLTRKTAEQAGVSKRRPELAGVIDG